ncbi:uncharacterized protein DUF3239 [Alloalcanivorax xenomutans]|uniref:DUF3239 domain-containing protein n=1 Tax=Alloalcanivorax xenomutans TaxID=1094342 RepID=UPI000BC399AB|nr:DUF3239 domain-containing protein [Alloalcanivorax xenomutans]SOC28054.1 uncharacterized protein DUF3239 [Alloalcanivorax xenomutans]
MTDDSRVGQVGESWNDTFASRAMNMPPDPVHMETYDEYPSKFSPLFYVVIALAVFTGVCSFSLYRSGNTSGWLILLVMTLLLLLVLRAFPRPVGHRDIAYENGLLIPAIVIETKPLTLLALADMRGQEDVDLVWGCLKLPVKQLPNHTIAIDEKVPCVSMFGMPENGYWSLFLPRPVAWGYSDPTLVKKVTESLTVDDEDDIDEWAVLQELKDAMKKAPNNKVIYFDAALQKTDKP